MAHRGLKREPVPSSKATPGAATARILARRSSSQVAIERAPPGPRRNRRRARSRWCVGSSYQSQRLNVPARRESADEVWANIGHAAQPQPLLPQHLISEVAVARPPARERGVELCNHLKQLSGCAQRSHLARRVAFFCAFAASAASHVVGKRRHRAAHNMREARRICMERIDGRKARQFLAARRGKDAAVVPGT